MENNSKAVLSEMQYVIDIIVKEVDKYVAKNRKNPQIFINMKHFKAFEQDILKGLNKNNPDKGEITEVDMNEALFFYGCTTTFSEMEDSQVITLI